jgi:hypothetical protein
MERSLDKNKRMGLTKGSFVPRLPTEQAMT